MSPPLVGRNLCIRTGWATISSVQQLIHWFQTDPRRLCVLGVWLNLLGCAVLFYALLGGAPVGPVMAGIALTATAALCKVAGRDRFKLQRLQRLR